MPITAKELREQAAPLAKRIRELADKCHSDEGWSAEDRSNWDAVNKEYDELIQRAEELERVEQVTRDIDDRETNPTQNRDRIPGREDRDGPRNRDTDPDAPTEEDRCLGMQAWCRAQHGMPLERRHREACERLGMQPAARELRILRTDTAGFRSLQEEFRDAHSSVATRNALTRSLSSIIGASGGYLVPETFVRQLEVNMLAFGGMLQVSDVINTMSGEPTSWPTADDTGNTGEQLGESEDGHNAGSGGPNPTFGKLIWNAYKFSSKLVLVPYELLEDSAFDLVAELARMLGERLGRIINTKATSGTGNSTFYGVLTRAALGVTAASATAIALDEILDLEHSVDQSYRTSDCRYMCHDLIVKHLRKIKDGEGRYMWTSGALFGKPDMLGAYQLTVNQDMASAPVANAKTLLFGNFRHYKIRTVRGTRMRRFDEKYGDTDEVGFQALMRADGNLLNAGTTNMAYLQQAA